MKDERFKGTIWEDAEVIYAAPAPKQIALSEVLDLATIKEASQIVVSLIQMALRCEADDETRNPFTFDQAAREQVRAWGERLDEIGGFDLMQQAYAAVSSALEDRIGDLTYGDMRILEHAWHGVGIWES